MVLPKSAPPVEKIVLYDNYHLQKNEPPGRNPLAAKNRNLFEALEVKCIESVTHLTKSNVMLDDMPTVLQLFVVVTVMSRPHCSRR